MNWLVVLVCASGGSSVALGMGGKRSGVPADGMAAADLVVRGVPEGEDDEDDEEQQEEEGEDEEDQGEGYSE